MSSQRCPNCGGYSWDDGKCSHCGFVPKTSKPRFELNKVDIFDLADGLKKKQEENRRASIPTLNDCPFCKVHSLFYDRISDLFECMNQTCTKNKIALKNGIAEYQNILEYNSIEVIVNSAPHYKPIETIKSDASIPISREPSRNSTLNNPLLLSVKMFLADIRTWRNQYIAGEYVCSGFLKRSCSKSYRT